MILKRMLNLKQGDVLGLDIGSCAIKMIALSRDAEGVKVKAAGVAEITTNIEDCLNQTVSDNITAHANIVKAIRECFAIAKVRAKAKLGTTLAVCSVSGSEVAVRDFAFPSLPPEDIEGAVSLEAAQVCPFNADQAAVHYQLISGNDDKTRGVLVAATNVLVTNKIQLAKEAGLKCVLMDIDGLALLNCFHGLADIQEKSAAGILNVGGTYTTLAVMSNDGWPFIRDTAYAGNDIIKHISENSDISIEDVKNALFHSGCSVQGSEPQNTEVSTQYEQSLEKACEELITGVSETLRFYAAQEKSVPVRKIYVCGGFADSKGFVELLNRRLGVEAILWNPFDNIRCDASQGCRDILKKNGPTLAVAAGLAMRSI